MGRYGPLIPPSWRERWRFRVAFWSIVTLTTCRNDESQVFGFRVLRRLLKVTRKPSANPSSSCSLGAFAGNPVESITIFVSIIEVSSEHTTGMIALSISVGDGGRADGGATGGVNTSRLSLNHHVYSFLDLTSILRASTEVPLHRVHAKDGSLRLWCNRHFRYFLHSRL
jgi:hypothetical protein